jgi:CxxC-x17-CxxC domain-containing protein
VGAIARNRLPIQPKSSERNGVAHRHNTLDITSSHFESLPSSANTHLFFTFWAILQRPQVNLASQFFPCVYFFFRRLHAPSFRKRFVFSMADTMILQCRDCGREFEFTVGEQEFYASRGLTNSPTRCPECRAARKAGNQRGGYQRNSSNDRPPRQMYAAVCAHCGRETQVPFQPRNDRPVYCRDCFDQQRSDSRW